MLTQTKIYAVRDLMTSNPAVVRPDDSLRHVVKKMRAQLFRQFPVVQSGKLVGIITDRDLRLALNEPWMGHLSYGGDHRLDRLQVHEFMTTNPMSISPNTPAYKAATQLNSYKFGALPVVEDDKLVGIISVTDILDCFAKHQQQMEERIGD